MTKILIIVGILVLGSVLVGAISFRNQSRLAELQQAKDRGSIRWHAEVAKAKGKSEAEIQSSMVYYAVPRNLQEGVDYYHVVVAEPLESRSYPLSDDIRTWYKFRRIEELSAPVRACTSCPTTDSAPPEMLPLKADEFLAAQVGGETIVDGVRITSKDPKFARFRNGQRYLIFVSFDPQKIVGLFEMGPWGVFVITPQGTLEPIDKKLDHPLRTELAVQFGDNLDRLSAQLRKQAGKAKN